LLYYFLLLNEILTPLHCLEEKCRSCANDQAQEESDFSTTTGARRQWTNAFKLSRVA